MNNELIKQYCKVVPKEYYRVPYTLFNTDIRFFTVLSQRSIGKTTGVLLWCILDYIKNGVTSAYIRTSKNEIKQSTIENLFNVILNSGYIELLTDGDYNSIYYHWRKAYLCKKDEKGKIIDCDSKAFLDILSTDSNLDYKSTLNLPTCKYLIYDEFIKDYYNKNDFFNFFDLHSTIVRKRENVYTFLLANTININSMWFKHLLIDDIKKMKMGDKKLFVTPQGTKNYVEILGQNAKIKQISQKINQLYYGFCNSQLNSITGNETWSYDYYPQMTFDYNQNDIINTYYLIYYSQLFELTLLSSKIGSILYMHETDFIPQNSDYIFVTNDYNITNSNEYKKLGGGTRLTKYIILLYRIGKFYTDTPFTHDIFVQYCLDNKILL